MVEDDVPDRISERMSEIRERFAVRSLSVFGSAARGELGPESDVDILVEFQGASTFDRYMGLKFYLEELLDRPVDLVTPNALRPELASTVEREGVHVA